MTNMANKQDKLDIIIEKLKKLDTLDVKIDNFSAELKSLSDCVTSLQVDIEEVRGDTTDNAAAIREVKAQLNVMAMTQDTKIREMQLTINNREQQLRACTIRIFNVPVITGESAENFKILTLRTYDIIRPILVEAKAAGDVATVQQLHNVIEACYRLPGGENPKPGTPPPPVIVKLTSKQTKIAIMKHKKKVLQAADDEQEFVAGAAGGRRKRGFIIVEDLTGPTHKLLRALQEDARTEKVWTVNGRIHYTLTGKTGYKVVRNVFDSLHQILGPTLRPDPRSSSLPPPP